MHVIEGEEGNEQDQMARTVSECLSGVNHTVARSVACRASLPQGHVVWERCLSSPFLKLQVFFYCSISPSLFLSALQEDQAKREQGTKEAMSSLEALGGLTARSARSQRGLHEVRVDVL